MKHRWFKKTGWIYFPIHPMGFMVTLLATVFTVPVAMAVTMSRYSVSDDLYDLFVYGTCTGFWWKWIAENTIIKNAAKT